MKKLTSVLFLCLFMTMGCCQQEGWYEECVRRGDVICIDIYPKCECKNKGD